MPASTPHPSLEFVVDGQPWAYHYKAYIVLNKPKGYECSRDPKHHLGIFHLLPPQFAERGVQSVGRLDQNTTGLLLLSDDGAFVQDVTSPKRKVPKVYLTTVAIRWTTRNSPDRATACCCMANQSRTRRSRRNRAANICSN